MMCWFFFLCVCDVKQKMVFSLFLFFLSLFSSASFSCSGLDRYVFLTMYSLTKKRKWLERALHFAAVYYMPEYKSQMMTPDRPFSLFEVKMQLRLSITISIYSLTALSDKQVVHCYPHHGIFIFTLTLLCYFEFLNSRALLEWFAC